MIDLNWPFPTVKYPLTPPKQPEYSDYAIKRSAEIKTKSATEDAKEALL